MAWIKKQIAELYALGKVGRFEKGIYYIPCETIMGQTKLDPRKVIEKKYLSDQKRVYGYYSGLTFMNRMGLTLQVPAIEEIYTNNEPSRVRDVTVGFQKIRLRRARCEISKQNVSTLCFWN